MCFIISVLIFFVYVFCVISFGNRLVWKLFLWSFCVGWIDVWFWVLVGGFWGLEVDGGCGCKGMGIESVNGGLWRMLWCIWLCIGIGGGVWERWCDGGSFMLLVSDFVVMWFGCSWMLLSGWKFGLLEYWNYEWVCNGDLNLWLNVLFGVWMVFYVFFFSILCRLWLVDFGFGGFFWYCVIV